MSFGGSTFPGGAGFALGDPLLTGLHLTSSGNLYYLDNSVSGASDSNSGDDLAHPWLTLSHAFSAAPAGSVIVAGAGHNETLASDITTANRFLLVGAGSSGGKPTAQFNVGVHFLTMSADYVQLRNIKFVSSSTATSNVTLSGNNTATVGCRFECGDGTTSGGLKLTGAAARVASCTFIATATTTQPDYGLNDNTTAFLECDDCVFDAGAIGFSARAAVSAYTSGKMISVVNASLLRGADFSAVGGHVGWIGLGATSGNAHTVLS